MDRHHLGYQSTGTVARWGSDWRAEQGVRLASFLVYTVVCVHCILKLLWPCIDGGANERRAVISLYSTCTVDMVESQGLGTIATFVAKREPGKHVKRHSARDFFDKNRIYSPQQVFPIILLATLRMDLHPLVYYGDH